MATLSNIINVSLIIGFSDPNAFAECDACKSYLESNGISFLTYVYASTGSDFSLVFEPYDTWVWGRDYLTHQFTNFPIITWNEIDDDGSNYVFYSESLNDLQNSSLIANKNLVNSGQ